MKLGPVELETLGGHQGRAVQQELAPRSYAQWGGQAREPDLRVVRRQVVYLKPQEQISLPRKNVWNGQSSKTRAESWSHQRRQRRNGQRGQEESQTVA